MSKAQAETNAEIAAQKVSTQDRILNEEIDKLEEKKLNDMKVNLALNFRNQSFETRQSLSTLI